MSRTDAFFERAAKENPKRWKEVSKKYPVSNGKEVYYDAAVDSMVEESEWNQRQRRGKSGGVPKDSKRRLSHEEWSDYRKSKQKYLQEWYDDLYYAKELADEGM